MTPDVDSRFLGEQATSALPLTWSAPLLTVIAVALVLRLSALNTRSVDRANSTLLASLLVVALLREPWVQEVLLDLPGVRLSDLRVLTHTAVVGGAVTLFVIAQVMTRIRRVPHHAIVGAVAWVVGTFVVLWLLALPARRQGLAVEELGTWQTTAYMAVYSLPMPIAFTTLMANYARFTFTGRDDGHPRVSLGPWAIALLACGIISTFDHLTRLANASMLSAGWTNGFTEWRTASSDALFLPAAAAFAALMIVPVVPVVRAWFDRDPASAVVRRLMPLWLDLAQEFPQLSLPTTGVLSSSVEREHRMRIECEDALFLLLPYMTDSERAEGLDPAGRCAAITASLERYRWRHDTRIRPQSIGPAWLSSPQWLCDEDEMVRIADAWSRRPAAEASGYGETPAFTT